MAEKKDLIKVVNVVEESKNAKPESWYACGASDYCDFCVGICQPKYH